MTGRRASIRTDELAFRAGTGTFALLLVALVVAIGVLLVKESALSIQAFGWSFWTRDEWNSVRSRSSGARCTRRCWRS
jgi:ABC-type phosphate transport system permease subunit